MKRTGTLALLLALVGWNVPALAQSTPPVRNGDDVIVARDVGAAELTLDGVLDEDVWDDAETISIEWNGDHPLPGGGQFLDGDGFVPADPTDPTNATIYVLRKGNVLWLGAEVDDASIGGTSGLWNADALIWAMIDREARPPSFTDLDDNNFFGGFDGRNNRSEFIYGWFNGQDTTATGAPLPGVAPVAYSRNFGPSLFDGVDSVSTGTPSAFSYAATVDGTANDDNNGTGSPTADGGYTMELFIDMAELGYDFEQADGDKAPFTAAIADSDYQWPLDPDLFYRTRTYWQFAYAQDYTTGVGYIVGAPGVTVSSGEYNVTEPEFTIADVSNEAEIVIDGALDDDAWDTTDYTFHLRWKPTIEILDSNPGVLAPYYLRYFRPGDGTVAVVDTTLGRIKMVHDGSMLYVGLDTDDAAISGVTGESGDGFRITLRNLDSLQTSGALDTYSLDFSIDSTGTLTGTRFAEDFADAIDGALFLKGSSTAANPFDIDSGYQMELAIDLTAFGYDEDLAAERRLWVTAAFFDRDDLDPDANSYLMRSWFIGERNSGAVIYGYLDEGVPVSNEDGANVPDELQLLGNYPNPFASKTKLEYALPTNGEVSISVYDVLGRRVALLEPGIQAAGRNAVTIDAAPLASGVYLYRVKMEGTESSVTGRLTVLK